MSRLLAVPMTKYGPFPMWPASEPDINYILYRLVRILPIGNQYRQSDLDAERSGFEIRAVPSACSTSRRSATRSTSSRITT